MTKTGTRANSFDTHDTDGGFTEGGCTEGGYVLATTALLLIPLIIFAALAVDVGGWYSRAAQIQRASDAAALAAVVWMPDEPKATTIALQTAAANGFDDNDPDVTVQLIRLDSQSVRVDITAEGETYFGGVVMDDNIEITRFSSAEYILPVPMGNPSSALGTGNIPQIGGTQEGIWLALNSKCYGRQQGDHISSSVLGTNGSCAGQPNNPQYDADGYYYVLDFPEGAMTQNWTVQFYEPGICRLDGFEGSSDPAAARQGPALQTRLYRADGTEITDTDNIRDDNRQAALPAGTGFVKTFGRTEGCSSSPSNSTPGTANDQANWISAFQIQSSDPAGRWILNVRSRADDTERGINTYAIRVTPSNAVGTACSTLSGANLTTCPRVFAKDNLGIYATATDSWGRPLLTAGPAAFYLAEIGPEHEGKTLEITLFDPGEGMNNIQIVAPDRTRPNFTWETIDQSEFGISLNTNDRTGTNNTCTTAVSAADPTTTVAGNYPCVLVTSNAFQNQTVRLRMTVPTGSACVGNDCWWRIRYQPQGSGSVTDKTVWSVRVVGDPIRLSE